MACIRTAESFGVHNLYVVRAHPLHVRRTKQRSGVSRNIAKAAYKWTNIRFFDSVPECIAAIREDGREIWATDLSDGSVLLADENEKRMLQRLRDLESSRTETCLALASRDAGSSSSSSTSSSSTSSSSTSSSSSSHRPGPMDEPPLVLPPRLAIVMGRELDGVSPAMLAAADKRVYLPMLGMTESFNLSVATGIILQKLFMMFPEARADMPDAARDAVRLVFARRLIVSPASEREIRPWIESLDRFRAIPPLPELRRFESKVPVARRDVVARLRGADISTGREAVAEALGVAGKREREDDVDATEPKRPTLE